MSEEASEEASDEVSDEAEEGDGFESEICYSVTHKVQFNVNWQIISYEGYLIKYLKFSEVQIWECGPGQ